MGERLLVKARGLPWEATTQEIVDFFKENKFIKIKYIGRQKDIQMSYVIMLSICPQKVKRSP